MLQLRIFSNYCLGIACKASGISLYDDNSNSDLHGDFKILYPIIIGPTVTVLKYKEGILVAYKIFAPGFSLYMKQHEIM